MSFRICDGDPGPGFWRRDTAHYPSGMSRHLWELLLPAYDIATRRAFSRYGSSIDHIDVVRIRGRVYNRSVYVEDEGELKKRDDAAERAIACKLWRIDQDSWPSIRNELHERLIQLSRRNPESMTAAALLRHIYAVREVFHSGTQTHFDLQPASTYPVGDWMRETSEKSALPVSDISLFLRRQVHSADFLRTLDLLVEQVRRYVPNFVSLFDSTTTPSETLKYLANASPDLDLALNSYMDEFGDRMVTGFDLTDHTWRELPGALLAVLRSRINASSPQSSRRTMEDGAEMLRQYVLPEHRNAFENGLKEAALAYGLHDEDVRITHLWPLGLLRRALLAAAALLISRGTMHEAGHVFQTTPAELDALIEGRSSPSASEMAERAVEWEAWDRMDSPLTLGDREDETSSHFKPLHLNRIDQATNFYLNLMESRHGTNPRPEWILVDGIAASPGRYEGPARVIREPADFSKLKQGDVLVSRITSPAYNLVMPIIGAVVTDRGGALCHSAIVAREFGIPAVVGTEQATVLIPDGARVLVDGDRGFVAVRS